MLYTLNFGLDGPDKLARPAGFRPLSRLKDTAFVLKQQENRQKSLQNLKLSWASRFYSLILPIFAT